MTELRIPQFVPALRWGAGCSCSSLLFWSCWAASGAQGQVLFSAHGSQKSSQLCFLVPNVDEMECNMTRQASCGEKCIPVAWLCNGQQECPDGSDEQCRSGII
ncbi:atrial natriuretic peptide-converting enzyme-like [Nannospalax galili]|uniref:atrial natriuretic peptide-converting enzyme-like n=1 Tax=Nannospalax galili TaxID=1026970 RepID=UPI00111C4E3C|nr:atrial natriuretic peptide-converting enzyme-like [Nannospalax galili]